MTREYKVGLTVYKGIEPVRNATQLLTGILTIAFFEGDPELWMIDDNTAVEELKRCYRNDYDREPESIALFLSIDAIEKVIKRSSVEFRKGISEQLEQL